MDTCRNALLGLTLTFSLAIGGAAPALSGGGDPAGASPEVTVVGASPAQHDRVAAALASFERAGLVVPPVEITFVDGAEDCGGNDGWFQPPATITVCSDLEFVVTHELAHAWIAVNLDAEARAGYIQARELEAWSDHDLAWHERGTEDAAFVMQQNLMITRFVPNSDTWQGRADAYQLLTGLESPLRIETTS